MVVDTERLVCAGCENHDCDYFTMFKGTLLCSYCLEDFLNENYVGREFEIWLERQRKKMKEDKENLPNNTKENQDV